MRYAESQLAMLVVLPDEGEAGKGIGSHPEVGSGSHPEIEASLSPETFSQWVSELKKTEVSVTMPKFTFRTSDAMSGPLQELGMKSAFTDRADFSGMADPNNSARLMLSAVFHETW